MRFIRIYDSLYTRKTWPRQQECMYIQLKYIEAIVDEKIIPTVRKMKKRNAEHGETEGVGALSQNAEPNQSIANF